LFLFFCNSSRLYSLQAICLNAWWSRLERKFQKRNEKEIVVDEQETKRPVAKSQRQRITVATADRRKKRNQTQRHKKKAVFKVKVKLTRFCKLSEANIEEKTLSTFLC
jgi:uncharacterized membrane protein YhiD involved in acid resistance